MPPAPRRTPDTVREDLARLAAQQEATNERAGAALKAAERMAVDLHRVVEGVHVEVRGIGERMATAEQVHRLEDRIGDLDRRVTEHTPAVRAVPELREKVEQLATQVSEMKETVKVVPALKERQDAQDHRNSRQAGALWVLGAIVGLLGLAGLRECGRWFVQAQVPVQHQQVQDAPEPASPTRRR
ncbi:hypothetical protein HRD49_03695 [Corallococcus exiguus]|uniref:hypothetical protein n=1 Tax=Corallococcus exiguus TaxID=83462 RepID=UPI00155FACA3|nr:hypothetical protein [Corallococcus exiguus]NRD60843.1 hypothetical protein [Corallococcus exiguus]